MKLKKILSNIILDGQGNDDNQTQNNDHAHFLGFCKLNKLRPHSYYFKI